LRALKRLIVTLRRERQRFRGADLVLALSSAGYENTNIFTRRDFLAPRIASRLGFAVWSGRTISECAGHCSVENQGRTSPEHKGVHKVRMTAIEDHRTTRLVQVDWIPTAFDVSTNYYGSC
jgi:hypothetical protein